MHKHLSRTSLRDLGAGDALTPDELRTAAGGVRSEYATVDNVNKMTRIDVIESDGSQACNTYVSCC